MSTYKKTAVICLIILAVSAVAISQLPEIFESGFGISPMALSVEARPGELTTASFKLSNADTRRTASFTIKVLDCDQNESGLILSVPVGLGARSCAEWITVQPRIKIEQGASERIEISISCPLGARGAYYAIINVAVAQAERTQGIGVSVTPTLGVNLEVLVPGPAITHLETKEILYQPGSVDTSPALTLKVENTGELKNTVEGDVLIYDIPNQFPVKTFIPYQSNGKPYAIYPGMTLSLQCLLPRQLKPGKHRVSTRLRLTPTVAAYKDFELVVPGKVSGQQSITAKAGKKVELDVDLVIEPDIFEVTIPPGGFRTLPIRVRNNDSRDAHVRVQLTQAVMEPSGMLTFPDAASDESFSWLSVSEKDIQPNRQKAIQVKASIPRENPPEFPLMGVVRLQAEAAATEYHDDWASGGEFATLVVVMDPKTPPANLEIAEFDLVRPAPDKNPAAAVIQVKNTGGKVAKIRGRLLLERKSGVEILHMDIGDLRSELILPGSIREFRLPLGALDEGDFRVRAEFTTLGKDAAKVKEEKIFTSLSEIPEGLRQ